MTGFWHQLRLLLWKNWLLRKRNKVRLVMEFVWPLILFLILIWVRTKGLKEHRTACNMVPKAMPSIGAFHFVQNYFCTLNNTCYEEFVENEADPWSEAPFTKVVQAATPVLRYLVKNRNDLFVAINDIWSRLNLASVVAGGLKARSSNDVETGQVTLLDLMAADSEKGLVDKTVEWTGVEPGEAEDALRSELDLDQIDEACASLQQVYTVISLGNCGKLTAIKGLKATPGLIKICEQGPYKNAQYMYLLGTYLNPKIVAQARSAISFDNVFNTSDFQIPDVERPDNETISAVRTVVELFNSSESGFGSIVSDGGLSQLDPQTSSRLYFFMCGREGDGSFGLRNEKIQRDDNFRDKLRVWNNELSPIEPDPELSPECNKILAKLEATPVIQLIWTAIKPLLRGSIFYSPNNTFTRAIMDEVDARISEARVVEHYLNMTVNITQGLQNLYKQYENEFNTLKILARDKERLKQLILLTENGEQNTDQIFRVAEFFGDLDMEDFLKKLEYLFGGLQQLAQCVRYNRTVGFASESEAVDAALPLLPKGNIWSVVAFDPETESNTTHLKYTIRMDSDKVDGTKWLRTNLLSKSPRRRPLIDIKYLTFGFVYIQDMVESSFIHQVTNVDYRDFGLYLQQFPFPCHMVDIFVRAISRTFPLFMVLSWVYAASMIIKSIVLEKETRLKEVMKVMGVGNGVIWSGWFVDSFIIMFLSATVLSGLLKWGKVIQHSEFTVIWALMISYTVSVICFSFLISTFFSRANSAAAAGGILFFVTYLPYSFLLIWEENLTWYDIMLGSLFSNVAFGFGCNYFARFEDIGIGAGWDRLGSSTLETDNFNLYYCFAMLWIDSLLYLLLALYVEAVLPGSTGIPKPWYFPVKAIVKRFAKNTSADGKPEDLEPLPNADHTAIEEEPLNLECGVMIKDLNKTYSNGKVAVRNLNMKFYEGQITSFLGHNGAGKTTTISMLTGLFPPSSGTAHIYGHDIRTEMTQIRENIGICPQHNVLFDRLTVEEHLQFFARVKGKDETFIEEEMDKMLKDLGIPEKRKAFPNNLSGGMKRKLCVAIAFVGGSKTVFLDEPTSGVDPFSRRSIWDLLIKYKGGRTIILTTHFMDEADLLGDRIAIISQGRLKTCGSSIFLKSKFGRGYLLHVVRRLSPNLVDLEDNDSQNSTGQKLVKFVRQHVRHARLVDDNGSEVTFTLPYSEESNFFPLLSALENELEVLGISSFGISDTPLEDVFLRITSEDVGVNDGVKKSRHRIARSVLCLCNSSSSTIDSLDVDHELQEKVWQEQQALEKAHGANGVPDEVGKEQSWRRGSKHIVRMDSITSTNSTGMPDIEAEKVDIPGVDDKRPKVFLPVYQILAIILKRIRNATRSLKAIFFEVVLPIVFIALTLLFTLVLPPPIEQESRLVTMREYGSPLNMIIADSPQIGNSNKDPAFRAKLKPIWDEVTGPVGFGTDCVSEFMKEHETCPNTWNSSNVVEFDIVRHNFSNPTYPDCMCNLELQQCNFQPYERHLPPKLVTPSADLVVDVSKYNLPEWILKTFKFHEWHMFGGYQFQHTNVSIDVGYAVRLLDLLVVQNSSNVSAAGEQRFSRDELKIWYQNRGFFSSIGFLNGLSNMVLRANLPEELSTKKNEYGISLSTHPLNLTESQLAKENLKVSALGVLQAICVIFALSFVPASFTVYLIEERIVGGKHLHMVSGVKPITYWCANFLYDFMKYVVSAMLAVLLFVLFDAKAYISQESVGAFVLLLALYGWAAVPLMYPGSHVFKIPSTAFVTLACLNLFIGIITTMSITVLENFDDPGLNRIGSVLKDVFLVFPQYCLGRGLLTLVALNSVEAAQSSFGIKAVVTSGRFEWAILGKLHFCLFVQGVLLFFLNLAIDYRQLVTMWFKHEPVDVAQLPNEDKDVKEERVKVLANSNAANTKVPLHAENLLKVYKKKPTPAVNSLCFEVRESECFGLLGVNGAGKTSTFKMLTGDVRMSGGKAVLSGFDVESQRDKARKHFGYCPQEDGFDGLLNAYEVLELYGKLRGMSDERAIESSSMLIKLLGLTPYALRNSGTYSGGNKRKLSTAVALIGNPDVIFLDEPTSGMDPGARRQLWKVILSLVRSGKSIVLTSHSMEECEALCTRLGIMVNGGFMCLGSTQHLKNRFGRGYALTVKLANSTGENVGKFLNQHSVDANLEEEHYKQVKFALKQEGIKLSLVFQALEEAKRDYLIEDYSLSQTSLDDIFVRFASLQQET